MAKKVKAKQAKPIKTTKVEKYKEPTLADLIEQDEDVIGLSLYYVHPKYEKISWGHVVNYGNGKVFILDNDDKILIPVDIADTASTREKLRLRIWWD